MSYLDQSLLQDLLILARRRAARELAALRAAEASL